MPAGLQLTMDGWLAHMPGKAGCYTLGVSLPLQMPPYVLLAAIGLQVLASTLWLCVGVTPSQPLPRMLAPQPAYAAFLFSYAAAVQCPATFLPALPI